MPLAIMMTCYGGTMNNNREEVYGVSKCFTCEMLLEYNESFKMNKPYFLKKLGFDTLVYQTLELEIYRELRLLFDPYWIKKFKYEKSAQKFDETTIFYYHVRALVAICPDGLNVANMNKLLRENKCQLLLT